MSIRHKEASRLWVEIVCHNCARTGPGIWFQRRAPISLLSEEDRKRGWRQRMDGEFECPACWAQVKQLLQMSNSDLKFDKEAGHGDDA